jgi:hypothetical protein
MMLDAPFNLQRSLKARLEGDWLGGTTSGFGAHPPSSQGDNFAGDSRGSWHEQSDLEVEAKNTTVRNLGRRDIAIRRVPAFTGASEERDLRFGP